MSCLNQISPLVPNPVTEPIQMLKVKMARTAETLLQLLDAYLPEGFFAWSEEFRPDAARLVGEAAADLNAAVFVGDQQQFAEAIRNCSAMYIQAVDLYHRDIKRPRRLTYSGTLVVGAGVSIN